MKRTLAYDDVLLVPQFSDIRSRNEIDTTMYMGKGFTLNIPIIASPMDTISGAAMAKEMQRLGATAVIHRYNTIDEQVAMIASATLGKEPDAAVGVAVGVSGDFIDRAVAAVYAGATFLCVDVAHGHHTLVKDAIEYLRVALDDNIHIMAGNVATLEAVNDLADWGADSARCNIGGGSICSTRIQTGHGVAGFQTILDCAKTDRNIKIIADGGIRTSGDIVKALAAGADAVMCGSLLSGTTETPGEAFEDEDGNKWKSYRGMASKEAQVEWRGQYSSFEGIAAKVPFRGAIEDVLLDLNKGIRSGLSYSGARSIEELQTKAQFIEQTASGVYESATHITNRKW